MSRAAAPRQEYWEPNPSDLRDINPYEEARLYTSNAERERWEGLATLFGILVSLDALERAYVREAVSEAQYEPACTRLLAQYKTIAKLVGMTGESGVGGSSDAGAGQAIGSASGTAATARSSAMTTRDGLPTFRDVSDFMRTYHMDHQAAAHRLRVGVPATVEHASASQSSQSSSERAKWVAETTQGFITFMDALKLKLRAKDQLHPLLSDLMSSYSRFAPSNTNTNGGAGDAMGEGRAKVLHWLITLNQMKASDEVDDDQARQMLFDVEGAYSAWFRSLQS